MRTQDHLLQATGRGSARHHRPLHRRAAQRHGLLERQRDEHRCDPSWQAKHAGLLDMCPGELVHKPLVQEVLDNLESTDHGLFREYVPGVGRLCQQRRRDGFDRAAHPSAGNLRWYKGQRVHNEHDWPHVSHLLARNRPLKRPSHVGRYSAWHY